MKKSNFDFRVFVISLVLIVGLAACQSPPENDTSSTIAPSVVAALPTEIPTQILQTEEEPIDQCLLCHIDKQRLIDTADPEAEVISENEGAG
jgi:hypothetical protein